MATTRPLSRKRRQTQARLLDAALEAFAERGFHGTSVEEVCERAGFSRGAFYSNYASKTELFIELYHRQADDVLATLTRHTEQSDQRDEQPGERDLGTVINGLLSAIPHDRRWFLINTEFALHAVRNAAAAAAFAAARGRVRAIFAERITALLGNFGRELIVPADAVARWLFALHEGGVTQAYMEPDQLAPHDVTRQVTALLLTAVTVPAGTDTGRGEWADGSTGV